MKIWRSCPASHSASKNGIRRTKVPQAVGTADRDLHSLPKTRRFSPARRAPATSRRNSPRGSIASAPLSFSACSPIRSRHHGRKSFCQFHFEEVIRSYSAREKIARQLSEVFYEEDGKIAKCVHRGMSKRDRDRAAVQGLPEPVRVYAIARRTKHEAMRGHLVQKALKVQPGFPHGHPIRISQAAEMVHAPARGQPDCWSCES